MDRRDQILGNVTDLVADFLYYNRRGDEDLPQGEIEAAIAAGEVTTDEIVARFKKEIEENMP